MGLSAPGIGSNLDVDGIISQLIELEQRPLQLLDQKEASFQSKLSAFGSLKGAVSTFQSSVKALNSASKFQDLTTLTSDKTVFTATSDSTAVNGTYSVEVTQLAQGQKLAALGQANTTGTIGNGTLTFDFGTISGGTFDTNTGKYTGASFASSGSSVKTITIDSTNNSLTGIRDAINNAKVGVTAAIINDGGSSPYRLSLTTDNTGKKNSLKITVSGDAALSNLLANDPAGTQNLAEKITAKDAAFKVDGISITKTSNTVSDAIQGVTLNLLKTNTGSPATLTLSRDVSGLKTSVGAFVDAFNKVNKVVEDLTAFNLEANQVGLLQGDRSVSLIQEKLRRTLTTPVTALTGTFKSLSDIGISFQLDGTLALDSTKLQKAINTSFDDIAGLFIPIGKSSDSLVSYTSATDKTKPGNYPINITQLATQGKLVGSAAAGLTITSGVNDSISITLDGASTTITLAAGTYASTSALAIEAQSKINSASAFSSAGISATVSESAGVLTITSAGYGAASKAIVTGGNGQTNLLGSSAAATTGADVAGTINNITATGFGQFLTGTNGTGVEGLKVQITGGTTGNRGTLNYSEGYADTLDKLTSTFLETSGPITSRTDGLNRSIKDIDDRRVVLNRRLIGIEARFRREFNGLDILLSEMQSTSNFLTTQLDMLGKLSTSRLGS